jgi:hypothetical protein
VNEIEDDPTAKEILDAIGKLPYPEPSPSFDAKMRAKLDAIDREIAGSFWMRLAHAFTVPRLTFAATAAAAGVLVVITMYGPRHERSQMSVAELEIAEDLELYQNYEVIENLDVLEDIDVILEMDDAG